MLNFYKLLSYNLIFILILYIHYLLPFSLQPSSGDSGTTLGFPLDDWRLNGRSYIYNQLSESLKNCYINNADKYL